MSVETKPAIHKLYLADERGGYNGYERLKVHVDGHNLKIGHRLEVSLSDIESCRIVPIPKRKKGEFIRLVVQSQSLNGGRPTPVNLIHVNFWGTTKRESMQAFVDEVQALIKDNTFDEKPQEENFLSRAGAPESAFEASYCLNIGLLVFFVHKSWFSFDTPKKALLKTWLLLLVSSLNFACILLFVIPYYNWGMAKNIERVGYGKGHAVAAYVVSLLFPFGFWLFHIVRWLASP